MGSLKQQLMLLVIAPLLLLSVFLTLLIGFHMKDRAILATDTKAKSDLATGEAIINLMYPGPWEARDGILYKGGVKISNNFKPVDEIAEMTGDTVTIFLGETRVSTTVREENGERAVGTKVSDVVATRVLKHGQVYLGEANVVGELYRTAYKPLRDANGKIIGMFYVGISKKLSNQLIHNSLLTIGFISIGLTLAVALGAWYFTQRAIIGPLKRLTEETRGIAVGNPVHKVEVTSHNEIGELAIAFNQMVDGLQRLAVQISKSTAATGGTPIPEVVRPVVVTGQGEEATPGEGPAGEEDMLKNEELPKGLHETTFRQIMAFLESKGVPMSAEEVGDGVNLTRVTARRYLEYLEKSGRVAVELKYGTVGRPVKLYKPI